MALIQFCCCWSTLRSGCYASALYTMVSHIENNKTIKLIIRK